MESIECGKFLAAHKVTSAGVEDLSPPSSGAGIHT